MTTTDMDRYSEGRRGGHFWFWLPVFLILFLGAAFSVAAYYSDNGLTVAESLAAGYAGLAGVIVGLFGAAVGVILGLIGALIGLVTAGGVVAVTLFVIASPILALILLALLLRRPKSECPDPDAH